MVRSIQCTAHSSRSKKPCQRRAILGGRVCYTHGGAIGHVKAAAKARVLESMRDVLDPDRALREASKIAYRVSLADFYDADGHEIPVSQWTEVMRSALKRRVPRALDVTPGERGKAQIVHDIELYDKLAALDKLFKHMGLLEPKANKDDGHITISWSGTPPAGLPGLNGSEPALIEAK
jgi:hypothetical protein